MFKADFVNGNVVKWRKMNDGSVRAEKDTDYYPRFYVEGDREELRELRLYLSSRKGVAATSFEEWKPTLSKPKQEVLRVDTVTGERLKKLVSLIKKEYSRTDFRFYNVGFSPQFRYCLQNEICPTPENSLEKMSIELERRFFSDREISKLKINGEEVEAKSNEEALIEVERYLKQENPDILLVNRGNLLDLLRSEIEKKDLDFTLGRLNGFQKLAGENTVSSYGKTVHSSARYNVPGRIVIDRSNSFLLGEATLPGLWDLVERSYRPLQELAWGSIGRLLTSIEVRRAYLEENTLTPWKNWEGEKPKKASKLHRADRGGFIFNPEPSIHEDVYEADFASLFPNIMVKRNISPETVNCNCCNNNEVPELDYSICQEKTGFISKVLKPLVEDRQDMKEELAEGIEDEEKRRNMQGSVDAIKWLLVSCFGYMGHSHASYGAIKCHQAIQAYDRDIMVRTKEMFEENGYTIAHGIIDSIWVQERDNPEKFEEVCEEVSEEVGIELEPEYRFEWCAFLPRTSSNARIGTLNRYFGKRKNGEFKTAGIEVEQDSTSKFVKDSQMEMIKALDRDMRAKDVIEVLEDKIKEIESGQIETEKLVIEKSTSKSLESYSVENRTVAAIKRSKRKGMDIKPGQKVSFVVKDDSAEAFDRVRLDFEADEYDSDFYRTQLIRAAESILSPMEWSREDIRKELKSFNKASLANY